MSLLIRLKLSGDVGMVNTPVMCCIDYKNKAAIKARAASAAAVVSSSMGRGCKSLSHAWRCGVWWSVIVRKPLKKC